MDFKKPKLPALSSKTPSDIRRAINAIAEYLGGVADKSSRLNQSIRNLDETVKNIGDYPPQPAPTGFAVSGGFNTIFLEWDQSKTSGFAYTEIWRATEDNLSLAAQVGSTSSPLFGDTPPDASLSVTYYYWIRYVNEAGQPGPYNSEHGTPGSTADEPGYVLEVLKDEITEGQLYKSLNERLDHIETTYEVKVDVNGRVTGFGMVADVNSTEFGINADRFWVADPSDSANVKIPFVIDNGQVVMDTALIRELTATNFVGEKIVADEVKAAGVKTESLDAGIITADKYAELRNSLVYNGSDSLDSGYALEVPFMVLSETVRIKAIRLSFKILPYRAYSTAAASGGGSTQSDTSTPNAGIEHWHCKSFPESGSSGTSTSDVVYYDSAAQKLKCNNVPSYPQEYIELATEEGHTHKIPVYYDDPPTDSNTWVKVEGGELTVADGSGGYIETTESSGHTHLVPLSYSGGNVLYLAYEGGDFTVATAARTLCTLSTANSHSHSVSVNIPSHTHGISYGIHEESNNPTIYCDTDNGGGYSNFATYTGDQTEISLTSRFSGTGWKGIRFRATSRCRIDYILECKLDITA
jgi:hypothetical protein